MSLEMLGIILTVIGWVVTFKTTNNTIKNNNENIEKQLKEAREYNKQQIEILKKEYEFKLLEKEKQEKQNKIIQFVKSNNTIETILRVVDIAGADKEYSSNGKMVFKLIVKNHDRDYINCILPKEYNNSQSFCDDIKESIVDKIQIVGNTVTSTPFPPGRQ